MSTDTTIFRIKPSDVVKVLLDDNFLSDFINEASRIQGQQTGKAIPVVLGKTVLEFSKFAAQIGSLFPGGFEITEPTLSQELAKREGLTLKGAHALMLRRFINNRSVIGRIARQILSFDLRDANEQELSEARRIIPKGKFQKDISKRLRALRKRQRGR